MTHIGDIVGDSSEKQFRPFRGRIGVINVDGDGLLTFDPTRLMDFAPAGLSMSDFVVTLAGFFDGVGLSLEIHATILRARVGVLQLAAVGLLSKVVFDSD